MNENESSGQQEVKQYYVLGVIVILAVIIAGFMLRNKSKAPVTTPPMAQSTTPTPTPGPITKLGCDSQYYNTKIGFPEYYLSVEGGDLPKANKVNCTFRVKQGDQEVATATVSSPLTDKPQRGGGTFRCTTKALALTPAVVTTVDITLKDDMGATATCSAPFVLPAP